MGLPSPEMEERNDMGTRITRSAGRSSDESETEQEQKSQDIVESQPGQVQMYAIHMRRNVQRNNSQHSVPVLRRGQRNRKVPNRISHLPMQYDFTINHFFIVEMLGGRDVYPDLKCRNKMILVNYLHLLKIKIINTMINWM